MNTALFTARMHGRVRTVYTAVHWPCTWSVYDPNTAVYPVPGRVYGPCTQLLTSVHDGPGTLPYISEHRHLHGRVPCTRSSLRPVYTAVLLYTAVYGRERTGYTAVHGHAPCTRAC